MAQSRLSTFQDPGTLCLAHADRSSCLPATNMDELTNDPAFFSEIKEMSMSISARIYFESTISTSSGKSRFFLSSFRNFCTAATCFGQTNRDRLFPTFNFLTGATRLQCPLFSFVHGALHFAGSLGAIFRFRFDCHRLLLCFDINQPRSRSSVVSLDFVAPKFTKPNYLWSCTARLTHQFGP
jgi:hypothetical protein